LLLVFGVLLLLGICDHLGISDGGKWLMFIFTFLNFANMKVYFYNVGLTDPWAFFLGIVLFYCYLKNLRWGIVAVLFLGPFVWPILFHMAALLFLFPVHTRWSNPPNPLEDVKNSTKLGARWSFAPDKIWTFAIFFAFVVVAVVIVWYEDFYGKMQEEGQVIYGWTAHIHGIIPVGFMRTLLPVSVLLLAAYGALSLGPLAATWQWTRAYPLIPELLLKAACLADIFIYDRSVQRGVQSWCAWHDQPMTTVLFFKLTLVTSVAKPLLFLVAHFVWYGPVVLVLVLRWHDVAAQARKLGPGLVLVLVFGLVMSLNPESRQSCAFFPFFAVLAAKAVEDLNLPRYRYFLLAIMALVVSKVWLPLNLFERPLLDGLLAMNTGNQMNDYSYLAVVLMLVLTAIPMYFLLQPPRHGLVPASSTDDRFQTQRCPRGSENVNAQSRTS
jgi:hypothetical protein